MSKFMRCQYCGLLQDEPKGVKECARCGGELLFESLVQKGNTGYLDVQMELDQVAAPAGQNVERHLLVTIRSPQTVPASEILPGIHGRPPVNLTAVLDVSGSMSGEKIHQAKEGVRQAMRILKPGDFFSLVTFNSEVACLVEPTPVRADTRQIVEDCLTSIHANGSTALDGGLELGITKSLLHKQDNNLIIILSDGQTNVGELDLELIGVRALEARKKGVTVSAMGIGPDYNEALLTEIASQGGGRFYHIQNANQLPANMAGEVGEVAFLAAQDVKMHLTIPDGATLVPLSAVYPVFQSANEAVVNVGDMPCDTELEIPLRLALLAGKDGMKLSISGSLAFRSPAGHDLENPLNRVTVRFMAADKFTLREGVVVPVVERVLQKMDAAKILGHSRSLAHTPELAEQQARLSVDEVRKYASLLGDQRAEQEVGDMNRMFASFKLNPAAAKQTIHEAQSKIRSSKDFNKKP